jgi:UTP--glucose-1-phosphate uridylyltransferase
VWCAREIVGEEPFALLLPDMLHFAPKPCLADMIEAYQAHGGNHIAVSPVPEDQTHLYGIVGVEDRTAKVSRITGMVEKPKPARRLQSAHTRALYPAAGDLRHPRARRARRRRRDPGHRCDDRAGPQSTVLRCALRRARSTIAARKIGFLMANIAYALARDDLATHAPDRTGQAAAELETAVKQARYSSDARDAAVLRRTGAWHAAVLQERHRPARASSRPSCWQ